jgi:DHA2 family multidrug resistance protein
MAYAVITLFCFIMISMSASAVPMAYLAEVQGYRPLQSAAITMSVAVLQLLLLPLAVFVLRQERVDSRWVNGFGLVCVILACLACSRLTSAWNREQFYAWQALSGLGQAFIVVSLLMMGTNSVVPQEGPLASPLINMPRAVSRALGTCLLELIAHFRGQLHGTRLIERAGTHAFSLIRGPRSIRAMPRPSPPPAPRAGSGVRAIFTRQSCANRRCWWQATNICSCGPCRSGAADPPDPADPHLSSAYRAGPRRARPRTCSRR